jgi:anti-anti-sigma regulatory factor
LSSQFTTITLEEQATLAQAQALQNALRDALAHGDVIVDTYAAQEIDFAVLQLLACAQKNAAQTQHRLQINAHPAGCFWQKSQSLGLEKFFNITAHTEASASFEG